MALSETWNTAIREAAEMLTDTRTGEATFAEIFGTTDDDWINGERDFAEEAANAALLREE